MDDKQNTSTAKLDPKKKVIPKDAKSPFEKALAALETANYIKLRLENNIATLARQVKGYKLLMKEGMQKFNKLQQAYIQLQKMFTTQKEEFEAKTKTLKDATTTYKDQTARAVNKLSAFKKQHNIGEQKETKIPGPVHPDSPLEHHPVA